MESIYLVCINRIDDGRERSGSFDTINEGVIMGNIHFQGFYWQSDLTICRYDAAISLNLGPSSPPIHS